MQLIKLRDYQQRLVDKVLDSFKSGKKRPLVVAATGSGKCFARGTPIMLYDGRIVLVEDVRVGDLLMGPDSKPRRVESLAHGQEAMYRVQPTKGDAYVVNESHILSLKITGMGGRQIAAPTGDRLRSGQIYNVTVRDYLRGSKTFKHCAKGWRVGVEFQPHKDKLLIPAYMMGVWLGDGSSRNFSITTGDEEIVHEIRAYASSIGFWLRVEPNSKGSVVIHLVGGTRGYTGQRGGPLNNILRAYGILANKHIPHRYKTGSRQERLELLAGIIDTDGYFDGRGTYTLTLKSERLLDDAIFVARSLGFACYKREVKKTCSNNGKIGTYYTCCISGNLDEIPCRVPRKKAPARRINKDQLVTGITVEPVGDGDYYGFELSGPDRLFLLGDFTVAHNTVVFSNITNRIIARQKRVLILAHRDQLIKQASAKLRENGVQHGIIMAGFTPNPAALAQVASVQTLVRRIKKLRFKPDFIIIDEAHLSAAKSYRDILDHWPDALVIGFTGSPCRLDGKPLGAESGGIYDDLVQAISTGDLVKRGFLVRPVVYGAKQELDLSGVKVSMGDYKTDELAAVVDKPKITGDAIAQYQKVCPGAPAVAWCVTVEHAQHVADEFNAAGIKAVMLCGEHDSGYRDKVLRQLASGEVKVVTFVGILVEGVDCPAISCIILLRPTMSLASYLQVIGRGLRPVYAPGLPLDTDEQRLAAIESSNKKCCYVLDHASLWMRHGFADEDREWDLNGETKRKGKKKKQERKEGAEMCKQCYAVFPPAPVCPICGAPVEKQQRKLEHVDGELVEITPELREQMRKARLKEVKNAKTLEELERIGAERGYSPGWAKATYEAKQRIKAKYQRRLAPPEPSIDEMRKMTLFQLETVAHQQGWPPNTASDLFMKFRAEEGALQNP